MEWAGWWDFGQAVAQNTCCLACCAQECIKTLSEGLAEGSDKEKELSLVNFYLCIEVYLTKCDSVRWTAKGLNHTYASIYSPLNPSPIQAGFEQNSLCYTAGPCWSFVLNIAVCTCPSQTP